MSKPSWLYDLSLFVGGDNQQPVFYTVHHILLILTCAFLALSAVFNIYFLDVPALFNVILIISAAIQLVIWYYSRFKQRFKPMAVLYLVIILLILLPANWFMNGGSEGSTLVFIYVAVIYSVVILYEINQLNVLTIAGMIALPIILIVVEYCFPTYILGYNHSSQRMYDFIFSNFVSLSSVIAMMMLYTRTLKREVRRANHYARQLQIVSETDALTSMKNRDYSLKALELAESSGKPFNVVMLDIDNFKDINDTYGHDAGDRVLKHVSSTLKSYCNVYGGLASRYGGEEFLIVTFFQTFEQTLHMAERLRIDICEANYLQAERVTISLGVAKSRENENHMSVIKRADKALYMSKNAGRNQVSTVEV